MFGVGSYSLLVILQILNSCTVQTMFKRYEFLLTTSTFPYLLKRIIYTTGALGFQTGMESCCGRHTECHLGEPL